MLDTLSCYRQSTENKQKGLLCSWNTLIRKTDRHADTHINKHTAPLYTLHHFSLDRDHLRRSEAFNLTLECKDSGNELSKQQEQNLQSPQDGNEPQALKEKKEVARKKRGKWGEMKLEQQRQDPRCQRTRVRSWDFVLFGVGSDLGKRGIGTSHWHHLMYTLKGSSWLLCERQRKKQDESEVWGMIEGTSVGGGLRGDCGLWRSHSRGAQRSGHIQQASWGKRPRTKHSYGANVRSYEEKESKVMATYLSGKGNQGMGRWLGDGAEVGFEMKNSILFTLGLIFLLDI